MTLKEDHGNRRCYRRADQLRHDKTGDVIDRDAGEGGGFFVWLIVAAVFVAAALLMPRTLAPLRRLWLKLGHLMSIVVSPIILALMYVLAIVVTGVLIRLFGKDLLSLKLKPGDASYWIKRNPPGPEFKSLADQF